MKLAIFTLLFLMIFQCSNAFARLHAVLITESKTVASSGTPEAIVAGAIFSDDLVIQAKSSNTQPVFVGPCSGTQDIALPAGATLAISEITHIRTEQPVDLAKVCLKVGVNGEGANIMYTKIVTI